MLGAQVPPALPEAGPLPCSVTVCRFLTLSETQCPPLQEGAASVTARSPDPLWPLPGTPSQAWPTWCTLLDILAVGGRELILDNAASAWLASAGLWFGPDLL